MEAEPFDDITSLEPGSFDPGWLFFTTFTNLCIITLAVAVNVTPLSVALLATCPLLTAWTVVKVLIRISPPWVWTPKDWSLGEAYKPPTDARFQILASDLRGDTLSAFWSGASILLSSTVPEAISASLFHTLARKPPILLALCLFTVGAIVGALVQNFTTLLISRSV